MDGAGTPYTGISPPPVLTGCPLCLRRLTAFQGRFNARTEAGQSYLPDMRVIAPKPATACLCAEGCSPYTSSLKLGSWPAQSRTAFLSGAYRMYPIDLFNSRTVASPHRCTVADTFVPNGGSVEICLKLSHISGDRQRERRQRRLSPCRSISQVSGQNVDKLGIGRRLSQFSPGNQVQKLWSG